jgi:hypothetical protein
VSLTPDWTTSWRDLSYNHFAKDTDATLRELQRRGIRSRWQANPFDGRPAFKVAGRGGLVEMFTPSFVFPGWSRLQLGLSGRDRHVARQGLADVASELERWSHNANRADRASGLR